MENAQILGISLILAGIVSLAGGVYLVATTQEAPREEIAAIRGAEADSSPKDSLSPEEKGRLFEDWVVKKFKPNYFSIKEWRSDKTVAGIYAKSSSNPDLQIEFHIRDRKSTFAVECKWRKRFENAPNAGITWATETQIANYRRFQLDQHIPVFVVLGVGGTADDPAEIYIIPLERLKYPFASVEYLSKFRRTNTSTDSYYEDRRGELR